MFLEYFFIFFVGISLISLTRYIILYNSHSVKNLSKKVFFSPPYNIGKIYKKYRYAVLQNNSSFYTAKDSDKIINKQTLPMSPVITDSALAGANVFHQYMCIDDNMYEGISRLSGEKIDTFSDLSAKLKTYKQDSQGLTEGSLNKIKGHAAESHVAEHFKEAGIEVDWPSDSNQEAWDLLINGNPIQVKLIKEANMLLEHFKNTDIPVIVPYDADNIPKTAFHLNPSENINSLFDYLKDNPENAIIVDKKLSNIDLTENIEQGSDLASGALDFNFPFITLAFSSVREIKLLKSKDTDIISALKHAGLDIAGTGAGGTMGAVTGSLILPVIGTLFGFSIGALLGRKMTNKIKYKSLKQASKNYEKSIKKLEQESIQIEKKYRDKFNQDKEKEQNHLNRTAQKTKDIINKEVKKIREWIIDREKPNTDLQDNLLRNIPSAREFIKKRNLTWIEYFWPNKKTIAYIKQIKELKNNIKEKLKNNKLTDRGVFLQKFSEKGLCRDYILCEIQRTEKEREKYENNLMALIKTRQKEILDQRYECMKRISIKVKEYALKIRDETAPYITEIKACQKGLKKEARKLGK